MIKELKNVLYDVDKKKRIINALEPYVEKSRELAQYRKRLEALEKGDLSYLADELVPIEHVEAEKFGFIQKHITRRKQYQEYKKSVEARETQIADDRKFQKSMIDSLEQELSEVYKKTGIKQDIYEYVEQMEEFVKDVDRKKTPKDMGLTVNQAMKLFEENGIPFILTEEDKQIAIKDKSLLQGDKPFETIDDFVFVHKTRFIPENDEIKTDINAGATKTETKKLDGMEYEYQFKLGRDTVHFAVNGAVASHANGNWNDCRYAIYLKAPDLVKQENLLNISPEDSWTRGNVELTEDTVILCPASEVKELKEKNPKASIIGYEGENTMTYDQMFVSIMGYSPRTIAADAWAHEGQNPNAPDTKALFDIFEKEGVARRGGVHFHSKEMHEERVRQNKNEFYGLLASAKEKLMEDKEKSIPTEELKEELDKLYSMGKIEDSKETANQLKEIGIEVNPQDSFMPQIFNAIDERKFIEQERTFTPQDIEETIQKSNIHERLQMTPEDKKQEVVDVINEANEPAKKEIQNQSKEVEER